MGVKWDPFRDLITFQERLNRLFEEAISNHRHESGVSGWHPPADICENDEGICIYLEIAGMRPEDIELKAEGNKLVISGERKRPPRAGDSYLQSEILMGPFHRTFTLPQGMDMEGVDAVYKQGILEIRIPRGKEEPEESIKVKIK